MITKRAVLAAKTATVLRADGRSYADAVRAQHLPLEQLHALQQERVRALVEHAVRTTRWYAERYAAAGVAPGDLRDPAAFAALPVVEKADVRERSADFRSREATAHNSRFASTGGSTGEPVKLLHDTRARTRALTWRAYGWWGVHPSDAVAHVYRDLRSPRQELVHQALWWPTRSTSLDTGHVDDQAVTAFLERCRRIRPALLLGYVGGIEDLARTLLERGDRLPGLRAVAVTAAPLSAVQRALMTEAFGAPVFDHYRCGEVPWVAGQCAHSTGLHTFADTRLVEVVDEAGRPLPPGEVGDVVVTDLTNRVFPLVRYRLGDRAALRPEPCPCGVTLPLMDPPLGRVSDALHLPSGAVVAGEGMTALFDDDPDAVRQFQVHQLADGAVVLRCVLGPDPRAQQAVDRVLDVLRRKVRGQVPVRAEVVDVIPHDRGKTRYVVSDVRPAASHALVTGRR